MTMNILSEYTCYNKVMRKYCSFQNETYLSDIDI